jgi:hypothetical protein
MINNKRAQGMSTSTIILLILGLIILVVLVLGFTLGWNRLLPFVQNSNNLDTISASCTIACSTNSQYDYCSALREVKDGVNDKFKDNCYNLATKEEYANRFYGINPCPDIDCSVPVSE